MVADKIALKTLFCSRVDGMDEKALEYERFCDVALILCGVADESGKLAPQYANSPYWLGDGTAKDPLRPSEHAKLAAVLLKNGNLILESAADAR